MRLFTAKAIDRLALLAATLCLAARQYDVPTHEFWSGPLSNGYVVFSLVLAISVFGAFTPFQAFSLRARVERRTGLRQQILAHYGRLIALAGRAVPPIDVGDLGLHVWRPRRTLRHPLTKRLARIATYRLGTAPAARPFTPARGAGVVGLCWQSNREVSVDVENLAVELTDEATFDTFRAANGDDAVMGLSWRQFADVRHRGAVFASPVRNGNHAFIGCVSVDAGSGYKSLNTAELWTQINSLCDVLGHDGLNNL